MLKALKNAGDYQTVLKFNGRFNCISWAAGITTWWAWLDEFYGHNKEAQRALRDFFAERGYNDCTDAESFDPTKEYVVLIGEPGYRSKELEPTHAIRYDPVLKKWTGKNGAYPLVLGDGPEDVLCDYGEPYHVMKRDFMEAHYISPFAIADGEDGCTDCGSDNCNGNC